MNSVPLLNCQEFPSTPNGPQYTEVELPKNSLVDVVFVASDFVDQAGSSIAIIDDIEVIYEHDPRECPVESRQSASSPTDTPGQSAGTSTSTSGQSASANSRSSFSSSSSTFEQENVSVNSQSSRAQGALTQKNEMVSTKTQKVVEFTGSVQETLHKTCLNIKCTFEDGM